MVDPALTVEPMVTARPWCGRRLGQARYVRFRGYCPAKPVSRTHLACQYQSSPGL